MPYYFYPKHVLSENKFVESIKFDLEILQDSRPPFAGHSFKT